MGGVSLDNIEKCYAKEVESVIGIRKGFRPIDSNRCKRKKKRKKHNQTINKKHK